MRASVSHPLADAAREYVRDLRLGLFLRAGYVM